jgi:uncharacterized membrane protein
MTASPTGAINFIHKIIPVNVDVGERSGMAAHCWIMVLSYRANAATNIADVGRKLRLTAAPFENTLALK